MKKNQRHYLPKPANQKIVNSLLDNMIDGKEYQSLLNLNVQNLDFISEMRKAIYEIQEIRKKTSICYLANVVNPNIKTSISIQNNDDLPFSEMVSSVSATNKDIDIILVTPGGSAQQVAKFVDKLRPRFDNVSFILPDMCMSAGTIFVMSGDEIIMDSRAYIGPIDPQVPNKDGQYVPAQSILTLIEDIKTKGEELIKKGQRPQWTDLQILNQIDGKEIGNAINASQYSIELVKNYLYKYKFRTWIVHSDSRPVTDQEKIITADKIATLLCKHDYWKTHSRGINRIIAWEECGLKIKHPEDIDGLKRAIRKFWALCYWGFEKTPAYKVFISDNYCLLRNEFTVISKR
jgi:hypothetical protein